ncbi:hypothetical protein [Arthrobacter sp. NyZ413]|uniref:hypothetical protein n=1 Tax=Arthrobacter sp. NyZ413 TaxID=3144669 RepID=UPI003BF87648
MTAMPPAARDRADKQLVLTYSPPDDLAPEGRRPRANHRACSPAADRPPKPDPDPQPHHLSRTAGLVTIVQLR